jgi:hypothetical protein
MTTKATNELATAMGVDLEKASRDAEALTSLTKSEEYLPQLTVPQGSSSLVKSGKFPIGHFCLYFSREKQVDLGESFECMVLHYRARASWFVRDSAPLSYYQVDSPNFEAIKSKAQAGESGYAVGVEYLLWIPSIEEFALFFMGSKSLRRESPNLRSHSVIGGVTEDGESVEGRPVKLKIKFIEWPKGDFHTLEVLSTKSVIDPPEAKLLGKVYNSLFAKPIDSPAIIAEDSPGRLR